LKPDSSGAVPRPGIHARAEGVATGFETPSEMTGRSWGRIYLARPILEAIEDGA